MTRILKKFEEMRAEYRREDIGKGMRGKHFAKFKRITKMRTMSLADAKARLSAAVDSVVAGEEVVITRRGRPVARIVRENKQPRGNAAALLQDTKKFVLSQPLQAESAVKLVRRMRDSNRY